MSALYHFEELNLQLLDTIRCSMPRSKFDMLMINDRSRDYVELGNFLFVLVKNPDIRRSPPLQAGEVGAFFRAFPKERAFLWESTEKANSSWGLCPQNPQWPFIPAQSTGHSGFFT
jgi:hypothetical protein